MALQKIANAGESLKSAGDKVTDVGKKMSVVSAGIVAAGTASTKAALDFEDAMAKVSTIADATEVPIDELEKAILDLSNQTGISSTEIADNVVQCHFCRTVHRGCGQFCFQFPQTCESRFCRSGRCAGYSDHPF